MHNVNKRAIQATNEHHCVKIATAEMLDKKLQGEDAVVDHLRTYTPSELNKFVAEIQRAYMGNRELAFRFKKLRVAKTGKKAPAKNDEIPENVDPETGEILGELLTTEEPEKGKKQKKGKGK